jgi:hypothetical protein
LVSCNNKPKEESTEMKADSSAAKMEATVDTAAAKVETMAD